MFGSERTKGEIFRPGTMGEYNKPPKAGRQSDSDPVGGHYQASDLDFKQLLEESQRMNQNYFRVSSNLDAFGGAQSLQSGARDGGGTFFAGGLSTNF